MNRDPLKCDECGRFVSYVDLESGEAMRRELTPDSAFTSESFETLCPMCVQREIRRQTEVQP